MLLSSIPFWFLPKSLPKQGEEQSESKSTELATVAEQENFLPEEGQDQEEKEGEVTFKQLAKGITQLLGHYFIHHCYSMPDFKSDLCQKKYWFESLHLLTPNIELTCLIIYQVEPKKKLQLRPVTLIPGQTNMQSEQELNDTSLQRNMW